MTAVEWKRPRERELLDGEDDEITYPHLRFVVSVPGEEPETLTADGLRAYLGAAAYDFAPTEAGGREEVDGVTVEAVDAGRIEDTGENHVQV